MYQKPGKIPLLNEFLLLGAFIAVVFSFHGRHRVTASPPEQKAGVQFTWQKAAPAAGVTFSKSNPENCTSLLLQKTGNYPGYPVIFCNKTLTGKPPACRLLSWLSRTRSVYPDPGTEPPATA